MTREPATNINFLACTLSAPDFALRRAEIQTFIDKAGSVQTRPDGVSHTFRNTAEFAHSLLEFIRFEQQCCSTITYELRVEPPHTELTLRLRAPAAMVSPVQSFTSEPNSETSYSVATWRMTIENTTEPKREEAGVESPAFLFMVKI